MAGTYFAALDLRFWVKLGTTASTAPTSSSGMTEVLSLTNTSISQSSDTQDVLDYATDFGFKSQIVTGNSYSLNCALNLDPTSAGYSILKQASQQSANNVCVQWYRELPLVGDTYDHPQKDSGIAFVANWSESLEAGGIATCSFDLLGYGTPKNYQQGSGIATLTITEAGSGLTTGTGISLVNVSPAAGNGGGIGATADLTLTTGAVTSVAINAAGTNYRVGDTLTITDSNVVGAGDTAPVFTVATLA